MNLTSSQIETLWAIPLFHGIGKQELPPFLASLDARVHPYRKGETLLWEGGVICDIGILLRGRGRAIKEEPSGTQVIISLLREGSVFGDVLAASGRHKSPVTVVADTPAEALFFAASKIMQRQAHAGLEHDILLRNYIRVISEKYLALHERINCLIKPTVRRKVMAFLTGLARESAAEEIVLPFDREGMAKYLHVERSALSRELSRMRNEGVLDYHKNRFRLTKAGQDAD